MDEPQDVGEAEQAIINGSAPKPGDGYVGRVVLLPGCSGTLLSPYWVLTAAHCVGPNGALSGYPIRSISGAVAQGDWVHRHPGSMAPGNPYGMDVALIHVSTSLGNYWAPLSATEPALNEPLQTYGYGNNTATFDSAGNIVSTGFGVLRTARITVQTPSVDWDTNRFGFGPNESGQINWTGDSGGPSFASNGTLMGVQSTASWGGNVPGGPVPVKTSEQIKASRFRGWAQDVVRGKPNDFNRDANTDILWHNAVTGELKAWYISGNSIIGTQTIDASRDLGGAFVTDPWFPIGSNDFNQDGMTDVLWKNASTGEIQIWFMSATSRIGRATVTYPDGTPTRVGPPWGIVSTNHFNGGGETDILWYNSSTGELQIWFMNGAVRATTQTVRYSNGAAALVGPPWSVVSTNDFDRNGSTDILWHNASTGETQIWYMSGSVRTGTATVTAGVNGPAFLVGYPWSIVGSNDFDSDGSTDILWSNAQTGETQIWYMNGSARIRGQTVKANGAAALVVAPWSIVKH